MRRRILAPIALTLAACCVPATAAGAPAGPIQPGRKSQLWTVDLAGHARKLTHRRTQAFEPKWSPDGQLIAADGNNRHLIVLTRGGRLLRSYRTGSQGMRGFSWAPDGERLAVVTCCTPGPEAKGDYGQLETLPLDGGRRRVLATYADGTPDWSADGGTIFFTHGPAVLYARTPARWDLLAVPSGGGFARPVVPDIRDFAGLSPDRGWLAFTRRERADDRDAVWVARVDGGDRRRLIRHLLREWFLWAGGEHGVFVLDESGRHDGAVVVSVNGHLRELSHVHEPVAWSPAGTRIARATYEDDAVRLETARPDGTHRRVLARFAPDTVIGGIQWAPGGDELVFAAGQPPPD